MVVAEEDGLRRCVMILFYHGIKSKEESSSNLPLSVENNVPREIGLMAEFNKY